MALISCEDIKRKFRYEPDTGDIYWVEPGKGKIKKKAAGAKLSNGYIGILINGKRYFAHRIAWVLYYGNWPSDQIDHINGNKKDNRICNLRSATNSQNGKNYGQNSRNTSGIKGVSWCKSTMKWKAFIRVDGVSKTIGRYKDISEASLARKQAEEVYFRGWAAR